MRAQLALRNCEAAIKTSPTPVATEDDAKARNLLILSVSTEILPTICDLTTALLMWTELENVYQPQSTLRQVILNRKLTNLKIQQGESIESLMSRARGIFKELRDSGSATSEDQVCHQAISFLPENYDTTVSNLLEGSKLTFSVVQTKLASQENLLVLRGTTSRIPEIPALSARLPWQNPTPSNSKPPSNPAHANISCNYCHKKGHMIRDCRKKKSADAKAGNQGGSNFHAGGSNSQNSVIFSAIQIPSKTTAPDLSSAWLVDSASETHITNSLIGMVGFQAGKESILVGNGQLAEVCGTGSVTLSLLVHGQPKSLTLRKVRYVPSAPTSLISVLCAMEAGYTMSAGGTSCVINNPAGHPVLSATGTPGRVLRVDLAPIPPPPPDPTPTSFSSTIPTTTTTPPYSVNDPELWHRRYAHISYGSLEKLASHYMVSDLPVSASSFKSLATTLCEPCVMSKQTRASHPDSDARSSAPMNLIHMDLCGPLSVPSIQGHKYFATFLDDYSRMSVVVPLKKKSDVASAVKDVLTQLETTTHSHTASVRTDNGAEYVNDSLLILQVSWHQTTPLCPLYP